MGARSAMAARIGTSRGDGGRAVGEWALWRLRLGDHGDWSGIASLHGQAESMLGMVTFSRQRFRCKRWSSYKLGMNH